MAIKLHVLCILCKYQLLRFVLKFQVGLQLSILCNVLTFHKKLTINKVVVLTFVLK